MRRLAWPVIVLLLVAAGGTYAIYTEGRIAALAAELRARPAIGDLIVVGKDIRYPPSGTSVLFAQECVRFRAFGGTEERCARTSTNDTCYKDARVGSPLPETCR